MKAGKGSKKSQTALLCVIAALIIAALIICSRMINSELDSYIKQTLNEISMQNVNSINCKVEDDLLLLEEISDRITNDDSFDSVLAGLASSAQYYGFKRTGLVYRDGKVYSSDNAELDIIGEDHIVRTLAGESVISDVFPDSAGGGMIFVYSVPVFDRSGETVEAAFFASCDTASFREHLGVSAFGGRGYSYIVKADGTTVIDSGHAYAYKGMENVFDAMESVGDNSSVSALMRGDMAQGKEGCLAFVNNGEQRYINYAPLGINDWYILSVVSARVTDGSKMRIMIIIYAVSAVIIIITVLFAAALIKSEKAKQAELERILYSDELTGGISFTKFCIDAAERLERLGTEGDIRAACVMADLDNFRLINNLYGKAEGDKTILGSYRAFSKALGEGDLLTRRMADRFYALIFFSEKAELEKKLESFVSELKNSHDASENEYILSPLIGVYVIGGAEEDIESITGNATIAHDTMIGSRGEHIAYYDESQRDKLKTNKLLEDKMELAHKNHEFIPYFQPKYDAATGRICGAEALVRWKNPDGTVTPPGKFIPLAERNGFIRVLDRDVFEAVCAFQRSIADSGAKCVPISVNVSRQLMYEQNFAADYIGMIKRYDLSPELIELEITESVLFDDYSVFRNIINTLRENGFRILMDDFGTGYSSLMMLSSVPIDNLKLDKSFIDSFEEEKGRKIIVCVIELAKSLGLPLTAEGVETRGQFDFLKSMGCEVIQGYYFSKPVPEEEFRRMLIEAGA